MHSQHGNNNPYDQDNETTWLDWDKLEQNGDLFRFLGLPSLVWVDSLAAADAGRVEIEPAAVEEDGVAEPLSIPEAA